VVPASQVGHIAKGNSYRIRVDVDLREAARAAAHLVAGVAQITVMMIRTPNTIRTIITRGTTSMTRYTDLIDLGALVVEKL
jgi:hypothetical protein